MADRGLRTLRTRGRVSDGLRTLFENKVLKNFQKTLRFGIHTRTDQREKIGECSRGELGVLGSTELPAVAYVLLLGVFTRKQICGCRR